MEPTLNRSEWDQATYSVLDLHLVTPLKCSPLFVPHRLPAVGGSEVGGRRSPLRLIEWQRLITERGESTFELLTLIIIFRIYFFVLLLEAFLSMKLQNVSGNVTRTIIFGG